MKYELAKQLKDAGFPFKDQRCQTCIEIHLSCDVEILPPLSELIEACGKALEGINLDRDTGLWTANYWFDFTKGKDLNIQPTGTPEEAVTKLWLALNKRD